MQPDEKKRLILSLIKDDLINTKLVLGLNAMGLCADMYLLNLSSTIFRLMGYDNGLQTEPIYDAYRELAHRAQYMDISRSHGVLEGLVEEIYVFLDEKKVEDRD